MNDLQTKPQPAKTYITIKVGASVYQLSEREKLICETYLRTRSFKECARVHTDRWRQAISVSTIKRWLDRRQHVKEYLRTRLLDAAEANLTKDEYVAKVRHLAEGDISVNKTTPFFWKLLGEAKGFLESEQGNLQNNIQINIVDGNGNG